MNETNVVEILVVEDTQQDLELTLRALRKANLAKSIEVARDGAEAVDFVFCEGAHAGRNIADGPKLILLDLNLPKIDGLQVLRRVKSDPRTKSIPIIMLTSSTEQNDVAESYKLGANSYMVKLANFERFAAAVQQVAEYWLRFNEPPNQLAGIE